MAIAILKHKGGGDVRNIAQSKIDIINFVQYPNITWKQLAAAAEQHQLGSCYITGSREEYQITSASYVGHLGRTLSLLRRSPR